MQQQVDEIVSQALAAIECAKAQEEVEQLRVRYLGKKGALTQLLQQVSQLPKEQRPEMGKQVNVAKKTLHASLQARAEVLAQALLQAKLASEAVDITLPGRPVAVGHHHPVAQVQARVSTLFSRLGFRVEEGPEIEDEKHNFDLLNIPASHPARAMADTFYFGDGLLLRTHTSPVQIRTMQSAELPLRMIAPGRVYRRDSDHTHTPMFHQVEGLVIDEKATFAELKGLLKQFVQAFFEMDLALRFRPSYFPFTEPSAEVDIQCTACLGEGCRVCGQSGWLEVLGCGMVHPNVLEGVGIDAERYSGYAFGLGLDRLAMLRYKIPDLRMMFENDVRFLSQF
jgi:phenylalanyl-tRNA synthetase alpha chain